MRFNRFSPKQMDIFSWHLSPQYEAVIADGAIRSGKTLAMSIAFVMWSLKNYNNQTFAFCGKTIESLRRNVIVTLSQALRGVFLVNECVSKNYIEISYNGVSNRYYLFGGKDERSYTLIQGITLAGVLFDEVALMPRSFVEQALARCSVIGSKFWFNCNPESPNHWFYTEWILKPKEKRVKYLHFTMEDNFSLAEDIKDRYRSMYSGIFYDRYILGQWRLAEGLIYTMFDKEKHIVDSGNMTFDNYYVSIDYGTVNPFVALLWGRHNRKWYLIKEFYYDSKAHGYQKTDEEYYRDLEKLIGNIQVKQIVVDPSAASFIACISKAGKYSVIKANNDVLDGIRNVSTELKMRRLFFDSSCKDTIKEFGLYSWDSKSKDDKPIKENDHAMDAVRYFVRTILIKKIQLKTFKGGL